MRLLCKTVGCQPLSGPDCIRCHTDLYDSEFIQYGWLDPLFRFYWLVLYNARKLLPRKCKVCGHKFWRGDPYTCGAECLDKWLPF